jgi:hypothetical protein
LQDLFIPRWNWILNGVRWTCDPNMVWASTMLSGLVRAVLIGALLTAGSAGVLVARGGLRSEDPWAAAHVDGLPRDVRNSLARWERACGNPAAQHAFSRSIQGRSGLSLIALHFEYFRCQDRASICGSAGCLHQVFASTGGSYRLVMSTYVPDIELVIVGDQPAVKVTCGQQQEDCSRLLRWNGSRFAP